MKSGVRWVVRVLLAACLPVTMGLVSGCAPAAPDLALLAEPHATVMAAEIDGDLRIDADGCVFVGEWFVVWPKGAQRLPEGVEVDGDQFSVGDRVHGSGGYVDQEWAGGMIDGPTTAEMERCTSLGDQVALLMLIQ